jgi:hypothetical protein
MLRIEIGQRQMLDLAFALKVSKMAKSGQITSS